MALTFFFSYLHWSNGTNPNPAINEEQLLSWGLLLWNSKSEMFEKAWRTTMLSVLLTGLSFLPPFHSAFLGLHTFFDYRIARLLNDDR